MRGSTTLPRPEERPGTVARDDGWTRLERTRTRPTRRAYLFGFLGLILYGAGANVSAGWVLVLAALLLGALPFAFVSARRAAAHVDVRRTAPGHGSTATPATVEVDVRAPTSAHVVVHDRVSGAVGAVGETRDGRTVSARVPLSRGVVPGGVVEVHVSDLFGLVDATAAADVPSAIEVLPAGLAVRGTDARVPWAIEAGTEASASGAGPEVLGVREYQHGDPVRSIHWRSSARRDQLVVRELAEDSRPRIQVELAGGAWPRGVLDQAGEAAAGIAEDARRGGYPVDVAADGQAVGWSGQARRLLALLPPHAGAEPRELAPPPAGDAEVVVRLAPAPDGVAVSAAVRDGVASFGTLPVGAPRDEAGAWLTARLGHGRAKGRA